MEITTMMFKWTRALSREGFMTTNFYFSELHKSSYYVKKIVQPLYVAMISNYKDIDELSLATSTFDMSFAVWFIIFTYSGHDPDYCHNPPFNIFHLRFDSKMIVRCNRENILREWYSIDKNETEIDDVALWSLENGITTIVSNTLYVRRNNLKGMNMRVILIKNSPFIKVMKDGKLDGIFGRTFEELSASLNFTFQIVSEVEEYGAWNPKESKWTGAIGEIISRNADICPSSFSITNSRLNNVDFTLPFLVSKTSFFIQEPQQFSFKWSSFFLTFSYSIWISILGILIVATILLIFLKINSGTDRKKEFLLADSFLEIWGILCQQGLADFPDSCSLRIVYFSIFILVVVLWAAYSAALISFLTTPNKILPFRSFEEFAKDGTYQLYVFRGSVIHDMFMNSKEPYAPKIRKLMIKEEQLSTSAVIGFNTVCENQNIALYTTEAIKENINVKLPCDIVSIKVGEIDMAGIILSKNNPYTDVINYQQIEKIYRQWKNASFKAKVIENDIYR
ncbi:PREDICTED: probable glutamate receptor [Polistes canadensis]|uniref:probable glutamate receptor n=1 Tax=Polistes canadensis TaxID=91411 RepID=UPI000718F86D|nr:PREDICTED: probable glutamate receptor [Polistes canadensis]